VYCVFQTDNRQPRHCPDCRQRTLQLFDTRANLPRDLAKMLYSYLVEAKSPAKLDTICQPQWVIVDKKGNTHHNISSFIDRKQQLWKEGVESTADNTCWVRSINDFQPQGPFKLKKPGFGYCVVESLDKRFDGFVISDELEFILRGTIQRPLIYTQIIDRESESAFAFWTFDRRDLFTDS